MKGRDGLTRALRMAAFKRSTTMQRKLMFPNLIQGEIALFKPRLSTTSFTRIQTWDGASYLKGGLDIVEVAVNPHSMLLEPYVAVLANELKKRIDTASSTRAVLRNLEQVEREDSLACSSYRRSL